MIWNQPRRMHASCRLVAACALIILTTERAAGQWKLTEPPTPGVITDFGVADGDPNIVQVGSNPDGAWETADGGLTDFTWIFNGAGLYEVHVDAAPIAPGDNQRRYNMVAGGGIRTTSNGGVNWFSGKSTEPWPPQHYPWVALAVGPKVTPTTDQWVLAGGDGKLVRNTVSGIDAQQSWSNVQVKDSAGADVDISDVMITDIEFVLESGSDNYVWASTSDCALWSDERQCAGNFNPVNGSHGVLGSIDGGNLWYEILIDPDPTNPKNFVNAVATVPGQGTWVAAATEDGLWATTNGGTNWVDYTPIGLSPRRITDVFYASTPNATIYIGTEQGIWRGDVGPGVTWSQLTNFPIDFVAAIDSTINTSDRLYVGYENGEIWTSQNANNAANTFRIYGAHGAYPLSTIAIKSDDEHTIYTGTVCEQGIFRGTVPTANNPSWSVMEKNFGAFQTHFHYVMRLAQDPSDGMITYATDYNRVWRTTDDGMNWFSMNNFGHHIHGLAVAPTNPLRVYAGNGHGNWGSHTPTLRVYRSDDQGVTWTEYTGTTFPQPGTETSLFDIAVSPIDQDVVYIGTFGSENYPYYPGYIDDGDGAGVVRSLDGGLNWTQINTGLAPSANNLSWWVGKVAMRNRNGTLITYIATLDGLYKMVGAAGTTWQDISPADGWRRFESIAVDPVEPRILYAGSSETDTSGDAVIYRSLNGGNAWSTMNIQMEPRAWANQYRVRDIQVGVDRAYAVVEGSGVYLLEGPDLVDIRYQALDQQPLPTP